VTLEFAVLAHFASVSATHELSVAGIFDRVTALALPVHQPILYVVMRFIAHPAEFGRSQQIILRMADEDGAQIFEDIADIIPNSRQRVDQQGFVQIRPVIGLTLAKVGHYAFDILINNQHVKRLPLTVRLASSPG
jgi:hypothetical protein